MRISDLKKRSTGNRAVVSAKVTWEDCNRPSDELFFATEEEYADDLTCNPHSFLLASILPAIRQGEKRLRLDEPICPQLREGVIEATALLGRWRGAAGGLPKLEAQVLGNDRKWAKKRRTGMFLSGGVDSLFSLRFNHQTFPSNHPGRVKDCVFVYGADIGWQEQNEGRMEFYERGRERMRPVAEESGVSLIPVYTNARFLNNDYSFWVHDFHGAFLGAVAHSLANRLSDVRIAATHDLTNLAPLGSHPLIDPRYSSADLNIHHDGLRFSRLAKTKALLDWPAGIESLRVCTGSRGPLNCGRCEKCIRTKTAFLALGVSQGMQSFHDKGLTADHFSTVRIGYDYQKACYEELVEPLDAGGHDEIAAVVRALVKRYETRKRLRWIDRKYLRGNLSKLRGFMMPDLNRAKLGTRPGISRGGR